MQLWAAEALSADTMEQNPTGKYLVSQTIPLRNTDVKLQVNYLWHNRSGQRPGMDDFEMSWAKMDMM